MKLYHILLLALVAIMMPSCSNEIQIEPADKQDEVPIQLNMKVPGLGSDAKAITGTEESEITYADVLAFTSDGSDMRFAYKATNIRIGSPTGNVLTITAIVKGLTSAQQFLVLANAQDELAAITIAPGETLTSIITKLVCAAGNGEFPARINGSPAPYKPIPMYAKTTAQVVDKNTGTISNFPMLRMVARVNVTLKDTITNFQLVEAALYNFKKAGYVAYDFSNFVTDKVTTPAIPTAGQHSGDPILEPTVFHQADAAGKILNSIFTYESPAFTDAQRLTGTALVIGGYYGGDTSKKVYYRIDLKAVGDATTNLSSPILRNHSYNVEVQKVSGPGEDTGIDAYRGKVEIEVHIEATPWDIVDADGDIHGRQLSVSALEKDLTSGTERVYFNSNQPVVTLDANGLNSSNAVVAVTSFLDAPATTNFHYTYNPTTKIGEGYIDLIAASSALDDIYRIYINADGLKREVTVRVSGDFISVSHSLLNINFDMHTNFYLHNKVDVVYTSPVTIDIYDISGNPVSWITVDQTRTPILGVGGRDTTEYSINTALNTTKASRTAFVKFSCGIEEEIVEVIQGWTPGGTGGVVVPMNIGTSPKVTYNTHVYGGNVFESMMTVFGTRLGINNIWEIIDALVLAGQIPAETTTPTELAEYLNSINPEEFGDRDAYSDWMVENSQINPTPLFTCYNNDCVNYPAAYYYQYGNIAANPSAYCPAGWMMPYSSLDMDLSSVWSITLSMEKANQMLPASTAIWGLQYWTDPIHLTGSYSAHSTNGYTVPFWHKNYGNAPVGIEMGHYATLHGELRMIEIWYGEYGYDTVIKYRLNFRSGGGSSVISDTGAVPVRCCKPAVLNP